MLVHCASSCQSLVPYPTMATTSSWSKDLCLAWRGPVQWLYPASPYASPVEHLWTHAGTAPSRGVSPCPQSEGIYGNTPLTLCSASHELILIRVIMHGQCTDTFFLRCLSHLCVSETGLALVNALATAIPLPSNNLTALISTLSATAFCCSTVKEHTMVRNLVITIHSPATLLRPPWPGRWWQMCC